ncbi:hypothetical protein R3W88_001022 [Solanum pinnatisectum]|uniref:Retrotransposon gag domain-containing protein n=1 Tax=Solanum pinnatisectum TaxID=50273 RepID=A0AAV9MJY8_9SOLN|nr:hypothetical protein R3W88_001022 [Solanum pinnatisectum]
MTRLLKYVNHLQFERFHQKHNMGIEKLYLLGHEKSVLSKAKEKSKLRKCSNDCSYSYPSFTASKRAFPKPRMSVSNGNDGSSLGNQGQRKRPLYQRKRTIILIRLCMPNTRSKGAPLLPYDPDFRELFEKSLRAQHPAHMMYEEDDVELHGTGATGAKVLPALPPGVKFTITSTMIQLMNLKGMFRGAAGDDANQHLMNFVAICKSQEIPGVNQTTMGLRLFPLSLTGEATNWLNEMPDDSIRTWNELKEAFLERFILESKELHMKDEISTHKQLPRESMHDTWWRFSQKLNKFPNHDLTERHLKQAFYRSLNYVTKPIVDVVCGGSFMRKSLAKSMQLLDEVSKNNRAWYTRDAEVGELGNDCSGVYVPPGNRDRVSGSSSGSKLEDMMAKVLQKVESTDAGQLGQLSASLDQRKNGSLPSDTIQNPKKDGHCMAIATRSGKVLSDPISAGTKYEQVLEQASREEDETIQVDDLEEAQPKEQRLGKPALTADSQTTSSFPSKAQKER